jgi:pimeloyl-ACP methyl ester carboxylesterase
MLMDVGIHVANAEVRIAYVRAGQGPPLVLLPGVGSRKEEWTPVLDRLSHQHDVIAIDLPGFGTSEPLPDHVASDVGTLTDAVSATIDALRLEHPHIAGNSLGGAIALELARRGRVAATIAVAPIGFWSRTERWYAISVLRVMHRTGRAMRAELPSVLRRRWLRRWLFALMFARPDETAGDVAVRRVAAFLDTNGFDRTLRTTRYYCYPGGEPTDVTICWGTRDRLLPPRQARRARRQLPRARHIWLPKCGHVAMSDDPALVAAVIHAATSGRDLATPDAAENT